MVDPTADAAKTPRVLLAWVSEEVDQKFGALPWVPAELDYINSLYAGDVLLNKAFDSDVFAEKVKNNNYHIIQLASHAAFLGNPQDSFLLAYDRRISMNALEEILSNTKYRENPLELLVLSACQSAEGNTMSSLGLAGVGIKAGARGAMGSLWYIDDKATARLIRSFYSAMKHDDVSKAEALRQSQLALLESEEFSHPIFSSSMFLVNNWI